MIINQTVKQEILGKITPVITKIMQDQLEGKQPDHTELTILAHGLLETYGMQPMFEALIVLNAGVEALIKSKGAPPLIPDGGSHLIN